MNTLVINCGSSSIKYALFDADQQLLVSGKREQLSDNADDPRHTHQHAIDDIVLALAAYPVDIVGHRVVHGGPDYSSATVIDDSVIDAIERFVPDAPMHNPYSLAAINVTRQALAHAKHVAVFDTAFHARMPRRSTTYAIEQKVARTHGIRRYGFHGISHQYAAAIAATFLQRPIDELRIITLHLGCLRSRSFPASHSTCK